MKLEMSHKRKIFHLLGPKETLDRGKVSDRHQLQLGKVIE